MYGIKLVGEYLTDFFYIGLLRSKPTKPEVLVSINRKYLKNLSPKAVTSNFFNA